MTTSLDPLALLADILDPPRWEPADRPPLEPHQVPPPGKWDLWVLRAGRGAGKTEACSRYFARWMREHPGHRGRIIAPTQGDAFEACIDGPSGLKAVDPGVKVMPSAPGGAKVVWPNGSEALIIGTPTPVEVERLRAAGGRHIDWWEEMAANRQLEAAWDQAALGLREGTQAHSIASTTPRSTKAFRDILALPTTVQTTGSIDDNPHLDAAWKAKTKARYEGTRLGRQELRGELLEDVEGALWSLSTVTAAQADCPPELPPMQRIVVAVDPATTHGPDADETGIVVAGKGTDGYGYVLADRSCRLSPDGWARRVVGAYLQFSADRIVAETNQGGELVAVNLRTVRRGLPISTVHAKRGKALRAEPVAALYEQGRVRHAVPLTKLEDQLTTWVPGEGASPDRLDALVYALTELRLDYGGIELAPAEPMLPGQYADLTSDLLERAL